MKKNYAQTVTKTPIFIQPFENKIYNIWMPNVMMLIIEIYIAATSYAWNDRLVSFA